MPALVDENGRVFYSDAQIDIAKRLHNPNYDQPTLPIFKEGITMTDNKDLLDEMFDGFAARKQADDEIHFVENKGEILWKRFNRWCDMLAEIKNGDTNPVTNLRREFQNFVGVTVTRQHVIDLAQSDFDAFRAWLAQYDMHFVTKDGEVQRLVKYEDDTFHFENLADADIDSVTAPTVDAEFKTLIPSLTETEFAQLEANILRDGIREPLTVWKGENILVDGHHRFAIAKKHNLEYRTVEIEFTDRDAVKMWIFENQIGRRNANKFVRGETALKLESTFAAQAKANQQLSEGRGKKGLAILPNLNTRDLLAKIAGVSSRTIAAIKFIVENATDEIKAALRADEITINRAFAAVKAGAVTVEDVLNFKPDRKTESPSPTPTTPAREVDSSTAEIQATKVQDEPPPARADERDAHGSACHDGVRREDKRPLVVGRALPHEVAADGAE